MKKQYNSRFNESNSIPLKRKYGENPAIMANANAPLRNKVLSFIYENKMVNKTNLKKFIMNINEGKSNLSSANMFLIRNNKYFIVESKGGETFYKLSNIGKKLINQFSSYNDINISESKNPLNRLYEKYNKNSKDEIETEDDEIDWKTSLKNIYNDAIESGADPDEVYDYIQSLQTDEDEFSDEENFNDEDEFNDEEEFNDEGNEDDDDEFSDEGNEDDEEEFNDEGNEDDKENFNDDEKDLINYKTSPRKYDFKDKGRPGLNDADDSIVTESRKIKMERIIENLKAKNSQRIFEDDEYPRFKNTNLLKKRIFEAEEVKDNEETENDELTDDDLNTIDTENSENDTLDNQPEEMEKVEITEFIITVDDVESAIDELAELGVTAERVPVEEPQQEVPADTEEEPSKGEGEGEGENEDNLDITPDEPAMATESLKAFFKANYLNEAEEPSDELGLGDQGENAPEISDKQSTENQPETVEPTTEFDEHKIKVQAQDWDILKGWLEEKGVDVKEMFGGDIESEEFDSPEEAEAANKTPEVSDDEIDFTGIGDKDKTKIKDEKTNESYENKHPKTNEIVKLYKLGKNVNEIAWELGIDSGSIKQILTWEGFRWYEKYNKTNESLNEELDSYGDSYGDAYWNMDKFMHDESSDELYELLHDENDNILEIKEFIINNCIDEERMYSYFPEDGNITDFAQYIFNKKELF